MAQIRDASGALPRTSDCTALDSAQDWQAQLATAFRRPEELLRYVEVDVPERAFEVGHQAFPMLVPRAFADRMVKGSVSDPLLRQVVPIAEEGFIQEGFSVDPVGESLCATAPGLLQKYRGRALLVTTGTCAVHCRYCFRRHYPYDEVARGREWWREAVEHIAADATVNEVLLSGGDPLVLSNGKLAGLVTALAAVPQVKRLRIHTRLPVVIPDRVDHGLLALLAGWRGQVVVVIHANHGNEIDAGVAASVARLREVGVTVLNQAVLLAGVNDRVDDLVELSERLFAAGVLPYYLHQLDPVQGAAHFAVSDVVARHLRDEVAKRLPGYLVPRLVREEIGRPGKSPL